MGFIYFLLFLIVCLILLIALPIKFRALFHIDDERADLNVLFPLNFFRANVQIKNNLPVLTLFLFRWRIYQTILKNKKETKNSYYWLISADISNIRTNAFYSLNNPFSTGFLCGAMGIISGILPQLGQLRVVPDFLADREYVFVESSAEINLGNTISNYVKNKRKRRNNVWIKA